MKTFRLFGMLLLAISLCLSACGEIENPIEPTPDPKPEEVKSEITIDADIITNGLSFTSATGEKSISFTTIEDWTLSIAATPSGDAWCSASTTSGAKGNANVKFSVSENTSYDDRSVSVTIKSGTASKTFTITQKYAEALLLTTNKYELSQEGGTIEIEVKANIDYEMEIAESAKNWITEAKTRTLTTYRHTLIIATNEELEKREGEIYFKSRKKVETVKIYQEGVDAVIMLSQKEYTVSAAGETISVDIMSNIEYGVQMPEVDWITDEPTTRGLSSHTLKYTIAPNEDYNSRSTGIIFYDKNGNLKDTLKVVQAQKDAIIINSKEYSVSCKKQTLKVKLQTNVSVHVNIPADVENWITHVSTKSLLDKELVFEIANNEDTLSREARIIVCKENETLSDTLYINQRRPTIIRYKTIDDSVLQLPYNRIDGLDVISNSYDDYEGLILLRGDLKQISDRAFGSCTTLEEIIIPEGVTSIGYEAFFNCENLIDIYLPNSLTNIGRYAFQRCKRIAKLELPENLENIGICAFWECKCLTEIKIPDSVTFIGDHIFSDCGSLVSAILPNNLTELPMGIFDGCTNLTNISLPENLIKIGGYAFRDCINLTEISIPTGVTSIGHYAFNNCSIKVVNIPDSCTKIAFWAFYSCDKLEEVIISENSSLTTIDELAFGSCSKLENIVIPKNVTYIEEEAFKSCSSLENVKIYALDPPTLPVGNQFDNTAEKRILQVPKGNLSKYESSNWGKAFNVIVEM